jgi:hypothetical protein
MTPAEPHVLPRRATDERGRLIPMSEDEVRARSAQVAAGLDAIDEMGDEDEQRETLEALVLALGRDRTISNRPLFQ